MGCFCCGNNAVTGESKDPFKFVNLTESLSVESQEFSEPPLSHRKNEVQFSRKLSRQLTNLQIPKTIEFGKTDVALVNIGSFKENGSDQLQYVLLQRPHHEKLELDWTESRRALEYALQDGNSEYQSYSDGMTEERRLQRRLSTLGLVKYTMTGDGNCQFRSISWSLYGTQNQHKLVRQRALDYMYKNRSEFESFLGEDVTKYMKQMGKLGEWGDELTLRAICESYGLVLNVISSQQNNWFLRYIPKKILIQKEVFLTYVAPIHYDAIRRQSSAGALSRRITMSARTN